MQGHKCLQTSCLRDRRFNFVWPSREEQEQQAIQDQSAAAAAQQAAQQRLQRAREVLVRSKAKCTTEEERPPLLLILTLMPLITALHVAVAPLAPPYYQHACACHAHALRTLALFTLAGREQQQQGKEKLGRSAG